jgi:hypothetical protein
VGSKKLLATAEALGYGCHQGLVKPGEEAGGLGRLWGSVGHCRGGQQGQRWPRCHSRVGSGTAKSQAAVKSCNAPEMMASHADAPVAAQPAKTRVSSFTGASPYK